MGRTLSNEKSLVALEKKVIIYFGTRDLSVAYFSGFNWFDNRLRQKRDRRVRFSSVISTSVTSVEIIEILC